MKSLAAVRYAQDGLEACGLSSADIVPIQNTQSVRRSLLSHSVRVSPRIFPGVSRSVDHALKRLALSVKIEAYVSNDPHPNAYCISMNGEIAAAVVITSSLIELLTEEELSFVIGHEIGHYLFKHSTYPRADQEPDDLKRLNILSLNRAAEISADRLGFISCPSMDDAFSGMLKIASGLSGTHVRNDITSYLTQLKDLNNLSGNTDAIYETHPMFPLRVRALVWFSMSEPYYYWIESDNKASFSAEDLNARIEADFAAATGFGLNALHNEVMHSVKIWALMRLVSIDNRLTKSEQALLAQILGPEPAEKAIRFVKGHGSNAPREIQAKLTEAINDAIELPEEQRLELLEELERVASAAGGTDEARLTVLSEIAKALHIKREVEIRPWSFQN